MGGWYFGFYFRKEHTWLLHSSAYSLAREGFQFCFYHRVHVLSLLQNKFGLVFFRLFDGALETSNFRLREARSAITLLRYFLHDNTQRGKIARVKFAEELGTMSKNRLRWFTLVRGPIWGIHSLTLLISWYWHKLSQEISFWTHR